MALLDNPSMKFGLLGLIGVAIGYMGYSGDGIKMVGLPGLQERQVRVEALRDSITRLTSQTDSVKRDVANGKVELLHKRIEGYKSTLSLLRQFVPERNEVPNLLDDISTRAKIRGVNLSQVVPQPVEAGPAPFDTYSYKMSVVGHFDQVGEFLSDIASLRRIIVPFDLKLIAAQASSAKALGDTSGAMLEASFQIRTFVKSSGTGGSPSGT